MEPERPERTTPEPLLATWIKWTMDSWEALTQMGPGLSEVAARAEAPAPGVVGVPDEAWKSALTMWQAFFSLLTEPQTVAVLFQGIKPPSEIILKMAQIGWGGYFHLRQQWLEATHQEEPHPEAHAFDDLEHDAIMAVTAYYGKDLQQLLKLPALGFTRISQESMSQVVVKFGRLKAAATEFMYLLQLPMKKSLRVMQKKLRELARAGEVSEDFKDCYKMWLRILEGHYMTLFQSPEFIQTLSHTLEALGDYATAKQELLADALRALSLPTHQELDELCQEIYLLKKEFRELARKLAPRGSAR